MELYTRTVGAIPISIGTSLALESVFLRPNPAYDPTRKIPQRVTLADYSECWLNLETLVRNIASSVDRVRFMECHVDHVLEILLQEIEIITSLFDVEGHRVCKPNFYFCTYKSLRAQYAGRVLFRESATLIQRSYDLKADQVLKKLNKMSDSILVFDSELKPTSRQNTLILTHYPYDLTSFSHFRKLDLLESHTGLLKARKAWNTKYANFGQVDLSHLPFFRSLLFLFGDKTMIEPQHRKIRQTVYDISIKEKWTPFTEMGKIREGYVKNVTHPADKQFLLSFN